MTRTFSDGHPKVLPACNFLSQYYFYNIFLQKSCRFSLQTLTKFEAAKTGSGVGFLRLTAVWVHCPLGPVHWHSRPLQSLRSPWSAVGKPFLTAGQGERRQRKGHKITSVGGKNFFWDHFLRELRNQAWIGSRAFSSKFEPVMDDGECSAVPQ